MQSKQLSFDSICKIPCMDQSTVEAKMTVICQGKVCTGNSASRQLGSRDRHCSESSLLIRLKTQLSAASSCRRRTTGVPVWERWNFRGRSKETTIAQKGSFNCSAMPHCISGTGCLQAKGRSKQGGNSQTWGWRKQPCKPPK